MAVTFNNLRPYQSLLVARVKSGTQLGSLVEFILDDIATVLDLKPAGPRRQSRRPAGKSDGHLHSEFIHYTEEEAARWTADPHTIDTINHLVLVCRRGHHVSIFLSDLRWRDRIAQQFGNATRDGLSRLQAVAPEILNAAFVAGNPTTVWLAGAHRQTPVKADTKVLSGSNIRDCLDPLEDQTFYLNAVRVAGAPGRPAVGVSPLESRVWAGPSTDWNHFRTGVDALLTLLEAGPAPLADPLPVLSTRITGLAGVERAFSVGLLPPQLLDDPMLPAATREELDGWASHTLFNITGRNQANANGTIIHRGNILGTFTFQLTTGARGQIALTVGGIPINAAVTREHGRALRACERRGWLKIWYESGHTFCGSHLYLMRQRDEIYNAFTWVDFTGFAVSQEKPTPLNVATVGAQTSLFCWVKQFWPNVDGTHTLPSGWLACDDGAQEIADFVHLDTW